MPARPRRSCLAVPASSPGMIAKAATLEADEVVVDLEDGVAVEHKEAARANLAAAEARTIGAGASGYALARIAVAARAYGIRERARARFRALTRGRLRTAANQV